MDPLEVLKKALSAPGGSDEQRTVLLQLRAQLEQQPGLIHPLCTMLVPTIANASDSLMKRWVLDLLHFAVARSPLPVDAKAQLAAQCLDVLVSLLGDQSQHVVKSVIQIFSSVYPLLFRTLCINRNPVSQWDALVRGKKTIVDLLERPATSLGVKEAALKFAYRVIQVQTRGVSDPRLQNTSDPNLTSCPGNHPFINAAALEAEGSTLIQLVLTHLFQSTNPDIVTSLVNAWAPLIKHRQALLQIVVHALNAWTPAALLAASVNPQHVRSVEKAVRILLQHIMRSPFGAQFQHDIGAALQVQEERMRAADEQARRSLKRSADESSAEQNGANKRPKLDPEQAPAALQAPVLTAAALAQFDFSVLPAPLVIEFVIANLQKIPEDKLLAAVAKFRESKPPAPPEAVAEPPVVIKTEPVDPLKMDMDDEAEITNFDLERVDRQVTLASPAAPAGPEVEPEPELILRLAEFVAPTPAKLDKAQRFAALATIERRAYVAASEVDSTVDVEGAKPMTRGAELQTILLVRSITRSGTGASIEVAKAEQDMELDVRDSLREKLCAYVLEDLPSRLRLASLWMNEEWYNDGIRREHDADVAQHYGVWLRRILEGYRARLDAKDRTFARFLLDLPELSDELLQFVRELCLDTEKMQVGFTTLRELVALRVPTRKAALSTLLDLTCHPEKVTRNAAIITVKRWVPDVHPMNKVVRRFALHMLRRLCVIPAPPKPEPTSEDSDEDGQLSPDEEQQEDDDFAPAYAPASVEGLTDRAVVLQHVELVFALCIKLPDLLDEIFAAYARMQPGVQEAIQELITQLVKSLGPNHGKLLTLLRTFPHGADSLALRVLTIFTENARPTGPLVAVVKGLVAERSLDARFLIPIMGEMEKADVVKHLPRIVSILNSKPEEQAIVRSVFTTVVATPPSTVGTSNQPRTRHSDMLTPAELMVLLHEQEMEIGLKPTMEAIAICFSLSDIFTQEVLAVVMQQIMDEPVLPVLFLRTVIQAVRTYRSLIGFVSTTLLSRLITKKIWQNPKLWDGFIMCAKLIAPASFGALLQLPKDQLRDLVDKQPVLKAGLREFVIKKAGNKTRVAHFLEVFGEDSSTPDESSTPSAQPQATAVGS